MLGQTIDQPNPTQPAGGVGVVVGWQSVGHVETQVVTSISFNESSLWNVSWVPQWGQKVRVPLSLDRKRAGASDTRRKSRGLTLNQVTNGAPVVRRQIEQWQFVRWNGVPVIS
jgi:hypothetical protein